MIVQGSFILVRIVQAVLLGDVVGSRRAPDRPELQRRLIETLNTVADRHASPLSMTIGDEFQGRYDRLDRALAASWHLHLGTFGFARLRISIGWGEITVESGGNLPFGQDGPAWWRARDALETLGNVSYPVRTIVSTMSRWDELFNAYLRLRDAHLEELDDTDVAIIDALDREETQRRIAESLSMHESSVSRRVHRHDLATLLATATPSFPNPD